MYPPQYNLPPINPAAFGGLPQERPQGAPPLPSQGGGQQPPIDMNKYLVDKVMEIKRRMAGGGDVGALSAFASAMPQSQQPPMSGQPNANPEQMRA